MGCAKPLLIPQYRIVVIKKKLVIICTLKLGESDGGNNLHQNGLLNHLYKSITIQAEKSRQDPAKYKLLFEQNQAMFYAKFAIIW